MGAKLSADNRRRIATRLHASKSLHHHREDAETKNDNTSNISLNCAGLPTFTTSKSADSIVRNGRTFHNEQTSTYWFPNDDEEIDRLVGVCIHVNW